MTHESRPEMQILTGLGVSGGIGIGKAVSIRARLGEVYRFPLVEEDLDEEIERLREAVRRTRRELTRIRNRVSEDMGEELSAIFDAHLLLVEDGSLLSAVESCIRDERVNAEWALHTTVEELGHRFASIDDEYLKEREQDLQDVSRHLIRSLQGISHHELSEIEGDIVVVADDLTPADAVRLGREHVVGFAIETGGRTSHTTIIARSLNIPAVAGLVSVTGLVTDEDPVIVDGDEGKVILHPTVAVLEDYGRRRTELARLERESLATRELQAVTRDGERIQLMANIDLAEEIDDVARFGAAGIGLYRSEFLYIEKAPDLPTEEDHLGIYRRLVEAAAPHPAIIRTYDLGGRKLAREVMATHEDNPVLGLRGIRLTLARPDVFRTQLRALYRAAVYGDLWIMIPLVTTVEEVRRFREFAADVVAELERDGVEHRPDVPIGIMVEVPSAAVIADLLAREVDFFSIGTNDLIQYALAVDRNNEHVADLYQPLHPGLLRMLRFIVQSSEDAGIPVGVCGEMAANAELASMLIGLGLRRLSVRPRIVPAIKTHIRDVSAQELEELATACLDQSTAAEVQEHLEACLRRVPTP